MYKFIDENTIINSPDHFIDNGSIIVNKTIEELSEMGYKNLIILPRPNYDKLREYLVPFYIDGENITQDWKKCILHDPSTIINQQISELKKELNSSDYKVIKCQEYIMNNIEVPYDVNELHLYRQNLRDRINELENSL